MAEKKKTEPEKIAEALARLDIDIKDTATIEDYQAALEKALGYTPSNAQIEAFTRTQFELIPRLEDEGMRAMVIEYAWGNAIRYAWEGHPGLWGWASISAVLGLD